MSQGYMYCLYIVKNVFVLKLCYQIYSCPKDQSLKQNHFLF